MLPYMVTNINMIINTQKEMSVMLPYMVTITIYGYYVKGNVSHVTIYGY